MADDTDGNCAGRSAAMAETAMWMPSSAADWSRSREIFAFFREIVDRLHGEEITRLRQKQAEYMALRKPINPHFLYNALEAIRSDALLAVVADIAETTKR